MIDPAEVRAAVLRAGAVRAQVEVARRSKEPLTPELDAERQRAAALEGALCKALLALDHTSAGLAGRPTPALLRAADALTDALNRLITLGDTP